jgi:DUF1365 family protein
MALRSALYVGSVIHHRLRPRAHRLRFRVFWMLIELDEIEQLPGRLRLFSYNVFNALSLHDRDHGDGSTRPLRSQVGDQLRKAGIDGDGPIRMLCMPRILGYVFNPLTVYFCHRRDNSLAAILYEVHNTFGERHSYLIPVDATADDAMIEQACDKSFYVSPFLAMDMRYGFRVAPPGARVAVTIRGADAGGPIIMAALAATRRELTDGALLRVLLTHPLLTLKVVVGIHWHALRMVLKGFGFHARPAAASRPVLPGKR